MRQDNWLYNYSPPFGDYNYRHYLTHPHKYFTCLARKLKWFYQRGSRGYSDCDVWNLDFYLTSWMPEALAQLKSESHGYPANLSVRNWNKKLDVMIRAFHTARQIGEYNYKTNNEYKAVLKSFRKDFNVLKMHYFDLWD